MSDRASVLVVDDTPENIDVLAGVLKQEYQIKVAKNGEMALKIASLASQPDLILLDIMMPGIDGYEVCRRLKQDHTTRHIPIIFVTAKITQEDELKGLELGAVDYITKPISPPVVKARVKTHLALYDQNRELDKKVKEQTREIAETQMKIVQRLGLAAEYKDNETGMHVVRMSHYSRILAEACGMSERDCDLLLAAAPMHDIGKIGIPDAILQKPAKLDADEWKVMQSHAEIGAEILGRDNSELLQMARIVALTHHEKWDGSGYPKGLEGEEIPRIGRIVAIADVFDALTSERPYKKAWTVEDAVAVLEKDAGSHFDPQLVPLFVKNLDKIVEIKESFKD
ncbi:response regulator [Agaribacterium haliotis]|uniref:response regulator n=1 Tax=Agaribacterium haliotis TaxID=2013869 RepID=UPI000BB53086|nr:two-component system response regulator [Agaribacterium haliotis]